MKKEYEVSETAKVVVEQRAAQQKATYQILGEDGTWHIEHTQYFEKDIRVPVLTTMLKAIRNKPKLAMTPIRYIPILSGNDLN